MTRSNYRTVVDSVGKQQSNLGLSKSFLAQLCLKCITFWPDELDGRWRLQRGMNWTCIITAPAWTSLSAQLWAAPWLSSFVSRDAVFDNGVSDRWGEVLRCVWKEEILRNSGGWSPVSLCPFIQTSQQTFLIFCQDNGYKLSTGLGWYSDSENKTHKQMHPSLVVIGAKTRERVLGNKWTLTNEILLELVYIWSHSVSFNYNSQWNLKPFGLLINLS